MFFFPYGLDLPYRVRLRLTGTPFFTVIIGITCCFIFLLQLFSEEQYKEQTVNYCHYEITDQGRALLTKIKKRQDQEVLDGKSVNNHILSCPHFMISWDINSNNKNLEYFAYKNQLSIDEQQIIKDELKRFNTIVHEPLTAEWWHDPLSSEIHQYLTSSLLHGDWEHLTMNLIFFFAFSMIIEQLLGSTLYLLFFFLCCYTTGIAYESGTFGHYSELPTIGLSGFVMGLMALTAIIYPLKKMLVFCWIIVFFKTIRIPAILLAGFYVATDIYGMAYLTGKSNINYISHLSGAITGAICGALFHAYMFIKSRGYNPEKSPE